MVVSGSPFESEGVNDRHSPTGRGKDDPTTVSSNVPVDLEGEGGSSLILWEDHSIVISHSPLRPEDEGGPSLLRYTGEGTVSPQTPAFDFDS